MDFGYIKKLLAAILKRIKSSELAQLMIMKMGVFIVKIYVISYWQPNFITLNKLIILLLAEVI